MKWVKQQENKETEDLISSLFIKPSDSDCLVSVSSLAYVCCLMLVSIVVPVSSLVCLCSLVLVCTLVSVCSLVLVSSLVPVSSLMPVCSVCVLGNSGGVVNSLDFCPASLKSLGCFYFRCVLSSQWKAVTVNLRILHCQR